MVHKCIDCGRIFSNSQFGLTVLCNYCYRVRYWKTRNNYRDSGHWYPWNIDGTLRKWPGKKLLSV